MRQVPDAYIERTEAYPATSGCEIDEAEELSRVESATDYYDHVLNLSVVSVLADSPRPLDQLAGEARESTTEVNREYRRKTPVSGSRGGAQIHPNEIRNAQERQRLFCTGAGNAESEDE